MNDHVNPQIAAQLHRFWPLPIAPGTPPDEARLVQADLEHQRDREAIRDGQALRLQQRDAAQPGMTIKGML